MFVDTNNYKSFEENFPYQGDEIYALIYDRNRDRIRTKRKGVAVVNLKRIFEHTFEISQRSGFYEMSLRQLSTESGISIGGIYACIGSKDDLATMACDCLLHVGNEFINHAKKTFGDQPNLAALVSSSLYLAEIMHRWLQFLYVDARALDTTQKSQLEQLSARFNRLIENVIVAQGVKSAAQNPRRSLYQSDQWLDVFGVRLTLLLLGEWVTQRNSYLDREIDIDAYAASIVSCVCGADAVSAARLTRNRDLDYITGLDT